MDAIAAKEEQCHQLEEYIEQLTSLLSETENELTEKAEAIRALEKKLKVGGFSGVFVLCFLHRLFLILLHCF